MALGFVQGTFVERNSSGTVNTKAFTTNVTAGDIIVGLLWCSNAAGSATFTQSAGTAGITWNVSGTTAQNVQGGSGSVFRNDAIVNTSGSCTVTATVGTSTVNAILLIGEFNVGGHSLVRDATEVENTQTATTSFASGSITTTNNPAVLICWYDNNGSTTAFTGGMTAGWAENVWDSGYQSGFASTSVTTAAAYSLTATQTSGGDDSVIYAYQATSSLTPINATVSLAGKSILSHGGRLINNASVSI